MASRRCAALLLLFVVAAEASLSIARLAVRTHATALGMQAPASAPAPSSPQLVLNEKGKGSTKIETKVEHRTQNFKLHNQNVLTQSENNVTPPEPTHDYTQSLQPFDPKAAGSKDGSGANADGTAAGSAGSADGTTTSDGVAAEAGAAENQNGANSNDATGGSGVTKPVITIKASGNDIPALPKYSMPAPPSPPPLPEIPPLPAHPTTPPVNPLPDNPPNTLGKPIPKIPLPSVTQYPKKANWTPAQAALGGKLEAEEIGAESSELGGLENIDDSVKDENSQLAERPTDDFHFQGMCTIAPQCAPGWQDMGLAGVITRNEDFGSTPFAHGAPFNGEWKWVHPRLCCANGPEPDLQQMYVLGKGCPPQTSSVGYGGIILRKEAYGSNPFGGGAGFNGEWNWSHPQLCRTPSKKLLRKAGFTTCIFARQCERQWNDVGWTGIIIHNNDLSRQPYNKGAPFNSGWTWVHPKLCCV